MGRDRGTKKFSFPLPRKSRTKVGDNDDAPSPSSNPSASEWPSHREEPSSKAHRVLGTSDALYRLTVGQASKTSIPASPGYMSITVSEASFGSQVEDRNSTTTPGDKYPKRPGVSTRPSSNVLGRSYTADGGRSDNSSNSHQLHPKTSSSTMRSHYDAKSSPLSISQQTSASAVRDRALRRGHPPVLTDHGYQNHVASPISPGILDEAKKENRKSKPARLDLSRLFPKPKASESREHGHALLSPTKMVNSPVAMSAVSDHFPRPMTREPTPQIGGQVRLKTTARHQNPSMQPPPSPVRKFQRDEYDNAKVHVRRPPRGVKHWFDALDEDSDELAEDAQVPIYAPKAVRPEGGPPRIPVRKASREQIPSNTTTYRTSRTHRPAPAYKHNNFTHEDIVGSSRLTSPSEVSVNTQDSVLSSRTKESAFSNVNRHDTSVLSFSSSEDELGDNLSKARRFAVRKSLDIGADAGEVVIGQAQAFEVRQRRRPSISRMSTRTASSAATIEVMYSPEPQFSSHHWSRRSDHTGSRRSSHVRQPSIIHEDEDFRPQTAIRAPLSPSSHSMISARTSASEPQHRSNGSRKMMSVTAEEEALLELMRKKRATMYKMDASQGGTGSEHDIWQKSHVQGSQGPYRTSTFLSMEASPIRVVATKDTRRSSANSSSPLLLPPRGRPVKALHESNVAMSHLCDSSASETWSEGHSSPITRSRLPHYLPTPCEISPIDPFPPSYLIPTASVVSPATTENASPLPSPMTPGPHYEKDVKVKVASSDTSNELDDFAMLDNGVIGGVSRGAKSSSYENASSHQRRRTASSGTEVNFPVPPTKDAKELAPMSEALSRPPSIVEPAPVKPSSRNSKRISGLALPANPPTRGRQSSVHSNASRTSSFSQSSSIHNGFDKRSVRHTSRGTSVASYRSTKDDRNSVSDDVLAAWNSLGGTY